MAAAFIGTLVALMIILKLACVLTGYEDRLPTVSNRKQPALVRVLQSSVNTESCASDKGRSICIKEYTKPPECLDIIHRTS